MNSKLLTSQACIVVKRTAVVVSTCAVAILTTACANDGREPLVSPFGSTSFGPVASALNSDDASEAYASDSGDASGAGWRTQVIPAQIYAYRGETR